MGLTRKQCFFSSSFCNICDIVFPSFRSISLYLNWCTKPSDKLYGSKIVLKTSFFLLKTYFLQRRNFCRCWRGKYWRQSKFPQSEGCHHNQTSQSTSGNMFYQDIWQKIFFYLNLLKRIFDICDITMWANGCHPNHTPWGLFLLSRYLIKIFYICKSVMELSNTSPIC